MDHLHLGLLLIALFYFQEIFVAPMCLLCPFEKSFDSYQVFVLEDKPFPYGTLCHCEKCRGFGLFVGTLLFWGVCYLIPSYIFY